MWLIGTILKNHNTKIENKGLPLGNLTSQFFANLYLNGFDHFVKEQLRTDYYLRYVDDFVILHISKTVLLTWQETIRHFLTKNLELEIHPEKSRIIPLRRGVTLLGFRVFSGHKLLKKSNSRRIWKRLNKMKQKYDKGEMSRVEVVRSLEGWLAYAEFANTYNFRKKVVAKFNQLFSKRE